MPKAILLPLVALSLVVCSCPASAAAGTLVPPGNSAANQYTETFPTSKGEEESEGKKKGGVTPAQVLGAGRAHRLEDKGAAGKAVADFAAETSPTVEVPTETAAGDGNGKAAKPRGNTDENGAGGPGNGGEEGSQGPAGAGNAGGGQTPSGGAGSAAASAGSSGLGEIAGQATGTSAGTVGLWLPLILIAAVIWSAAYVWRNRQQRVV